MTLRRPDPSEYHPRYSRYMELVPETDLVAAVERQAEATGRLLAGIPERLHDHRYAPDKWTVREVAGHVADTERIVGFRLLTFGRGDTLALRRADEVLYVRNAGYASRPLSSVVEEYSLLRRSNILLLRHFPDAAWDRIGTVSEAPMSVRAIGYMMLGHERHHLAILREQYLVRRNA